MTRNWLTYIGLVVWTACSHSLLAAHSVILVLIVTAGLLAIFVPQVEVMIDLHSGQVAVIVAALIIAVRVVLAPYWIWKADGNRIAELKASLPSGRRLTPNQRRILTAAFERAKSDIPRVIFTFFNDPEHEAYGYMRDFMATVERVGISASNNGYARPRDAKDVGIILCVPQTAGQDLPTIAQKISNALRMAGIDHQTARDLEIPEFTIFVGPKPMTG